MASLAMHLFSANVIGSSAALRASKLLLRYQFEPKRNLLIAGNSRKLYSSSSSSTPSGSGDAEEDLRTYVRIGNSVKEIRLDKSADRAKIPRGYLSSARGKALSDTQSYVRYLRWLMQKDELRQDTFLIGSPPGAFRRHLALAYAELTQREVEYICLSRDTTEADIKQRREIAKSSVSYVNQCAINAALHGRILIIEGIEKAERNLLPILNNLLENREINLEDGHFLVAPERYDKLVGLARKNNEFNEFNAFNLLRVHEDFRVIAIGLPVPKYKGNPLDPPLRSRFQAHLVTLPAYDDLVGYLERTAPGVQSELIRSLAGFGYALYENETSSLNLPDFPLENLERLVQIVERTRPSTTRGGLYNPSKLLNKLYPYEALLKNEETNVKLYFELMGKFGLPEPASLADVERRKKGEIINEVDYALDGVETAADAPGRKVMKFRSMHSMGLFGSGAAASIDMIAGTKSPSSSHSATTETDFIINDYHSSCLVDLMLSHAAGQDFCVVGPQGCGKSELIRQFARLLDYNVQTIALFKDMTPRDLVQQRITLANGDTKWLNSPLIEAAVAGDLAVLDGIHRVRDDTLMAVRRLVQDRELELNDGRRLLAHDRYDQLMAELGGGEENRAARDRLLRIHPSFRIIATAEPPTVASSFKSQSALNDVTKPSSTGAGSTSASPTNSSNAQWLNSEVLNLFLFNVVQPLELRFEHQILSQKFKLNKKHELLFDIIGKFKQAGEEETQLRHIARLFSLRKLIRLSRVIERHPSVDLQELIRNACLFKFMPQLSKQVFNDFLDKYTELTSTSSTRSAETMPSFADSMTTTATEVDMSLKKQVKIPDTLFYEIDFHKIILANLKRDFDLGEHILLIGNQGTGKNKLVDKFLMVTGKPREYLQLHRDTTVHSLTVSPVITAGVVHYEDSPLVKAVKSGHVLVIDEADKAPLHVTSILKSLIESNEMILSDGRRIVPADYVSSSSLTSDSSLIRVHKDFRMIILANRPGFPFLGNDFFSILGDLLACHPIDNPDPRSEIEMLKMYAPSVSEKILEKLVAAFGVLRDYSDQGLISYPYSTRELVNIVKHLEKFPNDSLSSVLANVYHFDHYVDQNDLKSTFREVMHKFGIPVEALSFQINLAFQVPMPGILPLHDVRLLRFGESVFARTPVTLTELGWKPLKGFDPARLHTFKGDKRESRVDSFSELKTTWALGQNFSQQIISDLVVVAGERVNEQTGAVDKSDVVFVCGIKPMSLLRLDTGTGEAAELSLGDYFSSAWRSYFPRLKLFRASSQSVLVYEETSNDCVRVDFSTGSVAKLEKNSERAINQPTIEKLARTARKTINKYFVDQSMIAKMIRLDSASDAGSGQQRFVWYRGNSSLLSFLDLDKNLELSFDLNLPSAKDSTNHARLNIFSVSQVDADRLLVTGYDANAKKMPEELSISDLQYFFLRFNQDWASSGFSLEEISKNFELVATDKNLVATNDDIVLHTTELKLPKKSPSTEENEERPQTGAILPTIQNHFIEINDSEKNAEKLRVSFCRRETALKNVNQVSSQSNKLKSTVPVLRAINDRESGQLITQIGRNARPSTIKTPSGIVSQNCLGYLEIIDLDKKMIRYLEVPKVAVKANNYVQEALDAYGHLNQVNESQYLVQLSAVNPGNLYTLDFFGNLSEWETSALKLTRSLDDWKKIVMENDSKNLNIEVFKDSPNKQLKELKGPKHGKVDKTNAPHVGGNTWAGGSGGFDTAGLGGVGGPYRLDSGNQVFQVSEQVKQQVPEHIKKAAREMSQKVFKERLREIQMSPYDHSLYTEYLGHVKKPIQQLRNILESLEAKNKERQWLKNQVQGDLDDTKLVEAITGEVNIYKKRGEDPNADNSLNMEKPKRLKLVIDCSGSMYRFNGVDKRLERELESLLMVMEAFSGFDNKILYDVVGHSGDGYNIRFVDATAPPKNEAERLKVLKTVMAHSQFCSSGDHTFEATKHAIQEIAREDADDYFVVVLSDANFDRYGLSTKGFSKIMLDTSDKVNVFCIFIGTLGDQAVQLKKGLPFSKAFICLNTDDLPKIMQQIFQSAMLK